MSRPTPQGPPNRVAVHRISLRLLVCLGSLVCYGRIGLGGRHSFMIIALCYLGKPMLLVVWASLQHDIAWLSAILVSTRFDVGERLQQFLRTIVLGAVILNTHNISLIFQIHFRVMG